MMRANLTLPAAASLVLAVALQGAMAAHQGAAPASAQAPGTPSTSAAEIDAWLDQAGQLLATRTVDDAERLYQRALDAARQLRLDAQEAHALCGLGEARFSANRYAEARPAAEQCLAIRERLAAPAEIGSASLLVGRIADRSGRRDEVSRYAERARDAFEAAGDTRGRALATLQWLSVNRSPDSGPLFERAVADAGAAGARNIEAQAYHAWGDDLFMAADYEQALEKLERAAELFEALDARTQLGTVFNSLGRVYRAHGRLDEALRLQLKALDLHRSDQTPFEHMQSLNAVAAIQLALGRIGESRDNYERALALAERSSSPRIQDFLRANVAGLQIEQGQFASAAQTLEQVVARGLDSFPSQRYTRLSFAYMKLGRHEQALAAAGHAVDRCGQAVDACVDALGHRAAARAALMDRPAALADVQEALRALEAARGRLVPADFLKQNFHRLAEDIYSQAIALQVGERNDRAALETAELARARAFLDLLASRGVRVDEDDRGAADSGRDRQGRLIQLGLPSTATAAAATSDGLSQIAARLQSTLVLYWAARDTLFVWVVGRDGRLSARQVDVRRSRLAELVQATAPLTDGPGAGGPSPARPAMTTRGAAQIAVGGNDRQAWRALHDLLIRPIRDVLPARGSLVTIVPHGPLAGLSFAALQDARGRYFLEDYTIHYVPAGAVLQFTAARRRTGTRAGDVLLVADPSLPVLSPLEPRLPRLPGARSEVGAIAQLVPRPRITRLEGPVATESRVRAAAAGKAVVHLATHAIVREDDPMASYLAFARDNGQPESDGLLTASDVYGLDLDADLVVLSACRSASGHVTGDGMATFARAFIYSGTPSLVASLWDVADEPTNRLLPAFYREWFGGMSKARSLRASQLRLLRDLRAGVVSIPTPIGAVKVPEHPVFWAGFALVGEPD